MSLVGKKEKLYFCIDVWESRSVWFIEVQTSLTVELSNRLRWLYQCNFTLVS